MCEDRWWTRTQPQTRAAQTRPFLRRCAAASVCIPPRLSETPTRREPETQQMRNGPAAGKAVRRAVQCAADTRTVLCFIDEPRCFNASLQLLRRPQRRAGAAQPGPDGSDGLMHIALARLGLHQSSLSGLAAAFHRQHHHQLHHGAAHHHHGRQLPQHPQSSHHLPRGRARGRPLHRSSLSLGPLAGSAR